MKKTSSVNGEGLIKERLHHYDVLVKQTTSRIRLYSTKLKDLATLETQIREKLRHEQKRMHWLIEEADYWESALQRITQDKDDET